MRLTEKVDNEKFTEAGIRYLTRNQDGIYAVLNKLGEWEDLEEQGRLIELPCKVGDTVYEVQGIRKRIQKYTVISVHYSHCSTLFGWEIKEANGVYSNLNGFEKSAIGQTVFLTKEEAEAKLAEINNRDAINTEVNYSDAMNVYRELNTHDREKSVSELAELKGE